ncbi:hypothetical protein ACOL2Y_05070 [Aliarcobacter butzleri]
MKLIVKNKTSKGFHRLVKLKRESGTYEDVKNNVSKNDYIRDEVLTSLLHEQGYICAYCMQKINLGNSTIEHIIGQNYTKDKKELGKENQINYDNLLAVCEGKGCKDNLHCDKSRGKYQKDRPLYSNPLENRIMQNIRFSEKGLIYYKDFLEIEEIGKLKKHDELDEDLNIKYDLQKVLNLNCENLKLKRVYLINALKKFTHNWSSQERIKKELDKYSKNLNNEYEELSQVAIYFLKKKLRK